MSLSSADLDGETRRNERRETNEADSISFFCAGESTGTERCLSYDEKPLLLFQRLKDSGQSPVFMLRHIVSRVSFHFSLLSRSSRARSSRAVELNTSRLSFPSLSSA